MVAIHQQIDFSGVTENEFYVVLLDNGEECALCKDDIPEDLMSKFQQMQSGNDEDDE